MDTSKLLVGLLIVFASAATPAIGVLADAPNAPRPKLQIINGSNQPIDVCWLKSDTKRVPNGSVAPGKDTIITTTLGHRFEIVGRNTGTTARVTSEVPVQGFRFDAPNENGVPSFYTQAASGDSKHETRTISGWTVHTSRDLLTNDAKATARALELLKAQLEKIIGVVPKAAVAELQKVPLWISPVYPHTPQRAEYHPDAGWLREHGRDPVMAKGVEFTNTGVFESETKRMPVFALHELAHAYHDRVLGNNHAGIKATYEEAKASGQYDKVDRRDARGRVSVTRAYAMTSPQEYFAETTEAFFGTNDFFPFTRDQLRQHDPQMFQLLEQVWEQGSRTGH